MADKKQNNKRDGDAGGIFDATFGAAPQNPEGGFEMSSGDDLPF